MALVLLVEDEEAHASLIQRVFEDENRGWKIHHVCSINDARIWIDEHKGQDFLVISDYRLPDGTGLDLTKGAENPLGMEFPLIIITGVGSEKLAVQSLKSGAMDYVTKGRDLRNLPQTARRVMYEWDRIAERKRAERDLRSYLNDLEQASCDLDELIDKISHDMEKSLSYIHEFNELLMSRYSKVLDDATIGCLYKSDNYAERARTMMDGFFKYLVQISFYSSLVEVYSAKIEGTKPAEDEGGSEDGEMQGRIDPDSNSAN
ncbi:MAG TPA: response regulator [Methanotrichaceae archaeon]|nr:response regulator [Methanotrichaceae archaeon]